MAKPFTHPNLNEDENNALACAMLNLLDVHRELSFCLDALEANGLPPAELLELILNQLHERTEHMMEHVVRVLNPQAANAERN